MDVVLLASLELLAGLWFLVTADAIPIDTSFPTPADVVRYELCIDVVYVLIELVAYLAGTPRCVWVDLDVTRVTRIFLPLFIAAWMVRPTILTIWSLGLLHSCATYMRVIE